MPMLWDQLSKEQQNIRLAKQEVFEEQMMSGGVSRYWKEYDRAPDEGLPEQQLLDTAVVHLTPFYQDWIDRLCERSRTPDWLIPLMAVGAAKMADLTIRCFMREWLKSSMFSDEFVGYMNSAFPLPTAQRLSNVIATEVINIVSYQQTKEQYKDDWQRQSKFIKSWTPKRCLGFTKKLSGVATLPLKKRQDFGHHMIRIAETSDIFQTVTQRHISGKVWNKRLFVTLDPKILKDLHNKHKLLQSSSLLFRPMIVPPVDHTMERSGGYLNHWIRKEVVQRFASDYIDGRRRRQNWSQPSELVLEGLNSMMNTEWTINSKVLKVMETLFYNNTQLANLPSYSFDSFEYNEPYPEEGSQEEKAIWCAHREECWGNWFKSEQKRCRLLVRLHLAHELEEWDFWYMPYTLDFRGRAYSTCELLSCQGADFDRGLIMFGEARVQTEEGLYWLKIHIANLFDQDKQSLDDRVRWVDNNMEMLRRINDDPYTNKEWVSDKTKKNPSFQRIAAVFDLFRDDGMTQVPVQLDGACNGSQHWSAVMRDRIIGELTNVVPSDEPMDLYKYIANITTEYCKLHKEDIPVLNEFLEYWSEGIGRDVTKRSTMCDAYGLTFYGIQKYVKLEGHLDWIPPDRRNGAITELARAIKAGLEQSLSLPNEGKAYLKKVGEIVSDLNKHITYIVPSGFKVVHAYHNPTKRRSFASLFNKKELIFATHNNDSVDKKAVEQAISPNWIHSLDASHMFCTLYRALAKGLYQFSMVHDSYGCPAPDMGVLRNLIREEFYEMHKENQLQKFCEDVEEEIGMRLPNLPERGDLDIIGVLESDYLFA